ncbi:galectin-9 isoform X2 [Dromiciops gliroides]|uniref:galectin-9 isoform X2 n=1 Tax=Dromiciops gliroides TaxID=33562 RepID=UPI001CC3FD55|nr:galectin-9 isoform X2 [Dromiciops gliroides]
MSFNNTQHTYQNPLIPFSGPIHGGLQDGHEVIVNGSVLYSFQKRFSVNFQCGFDGNNIAFHFNPRFDDSGYVVCNTKQYGNWGPEERKMQMPFQKGMPFEILFQVESTAFKVMVNGNHFLQYQHRIPLHQVDTISIDGIVKVSYINFQNTRFIPVQPSCFVHHATTAKAPLRFKSKTKKVFHDVHSVPPAANAPVFPPTVYSNQFFSLPFYAPIFGGFYPSRNITISGTILLTADKFTINLRCGQDIAFHMNPRFKENAVVRNTQINHSWGSEERGLPSFMPFIRGQAFMVLIKCEINCFKVTVNGQHQFDYNHRMKNLSSIDKLEVSGDIQLTTVQVS